MVEDGLTPAIARMIEGVPGFMTREADYVGQRSVHEIKARTPIGKEVDPVSGQHKGTSGRLRESWRQIPVTIHGDSYESGAETDVPYANDVEFNTRDHIIEPRTKRALRFHNHGDVVFAARVHHPGTRGKYMMRTGLNEVERTYSREGERHLQEFLDSKERG